MTCLCGDTHCPSCGPAQGNWRCPICRSWADDGCAHVEAWCTGCQQVITDGEQEGHEQCGAHGHEIELRVAPAFQAQADALAEAEQQAEAEQMGKRRREMMITDKRAEAVKGLREMAKFLEDHPTVPLPVFSNENAFAKDREEMMAVARVGNWTKTYTGTWFALRKEFSGGLSLEVNIDRAEVCRKVMTGTKVIPAREEQVVETYDWVCDDASLLAREGA